MIRTALESDISVIQDIAEKTWWPTYSPIVSAAQLRFMVDLIYSTETLRDAIVNNKQEFILLTDDGIPMGFAAFAPRPEDACIFKLHKLYVLPGLHGKGYGKTMLAEVKKRAKNQNGRQLDLNVNRHNPAVKFYEKSGFKILREEDIPIGPYWMNDYVMSLPLTTAKTTNN